ncbi:hypothetical protein [Christiangramia aquimixticola]|uniref:hypothetical protein n=1 Tax=Christiangramia aquimixticola TaxID=1697558 RepID=UPI003AA95E83
MHSGKLPGELTAEDFQFLKDTKFSFIYGTEDQYLKPGIIEQEKNRLKHLFPENLEIISFKGGHEVKKEIISNFA